MDQALMTWRRWTSSQKIEEAVTTKICPYCGNTTNSPPVALGEITTNVICAVLLLTIIFSSFRLAEQWIDGQPHRLLERMFIWSEPNDSWNM